VAEPVALKDLARALEPSEHELIALVGGGGKTTTLLTLAGQLPGRVLATTTTRMGSSQASGLATLDDPADEEVDGALAAHGTVFVRRGERDGKSLGVTSSDCDRWFGLADHVVVEADGSRMRPFKAPRPHEPVVPPATTTLVACIGGDALGRVIADQCHNPLRVAAVAGCSPYQRLTAARAARVLSDDRGSRKACPATARYLVMVTKVDDAARPFATELANILEPDIPVVTVSFEPGASPR